MRRPPRRCSPPWTRRNCGSCPTRRSARQTTRAPRRCETSCAAKSGTSFRSGHGMEDLVRSGDIVVRLLGAASLLAGLLVIPVSGRQQAPASPAHTQIVLLGTGDPAADPDQSGPATAVIVNGTPY